MNLADFKLPEVLHLGIGSRVSGKSRTENVKIETQEKESPSTL